MNFQWLRVGVITTRIGARAGSSAIRSTNAPARRNKCNATAPRFPARCLIASTFRSKSPPSNITISAAYPLSGLRCQVGRRMHYRGGGPSVKHLVKRLCQSTCGWLDFGCWSQPLAAPNTSWGSMFSRFLRKEQGNWKVPRPRNSSVPSCRSSQ